MTKRTYNLVKPTKFFKKWGIDTKMLAQQEDVSRTALHMRVQLYGTPFQRKQQPNKFELATGRACSELVEITGLKPTAIYSRFRQFNDPFHVPHKNWLFGDVNYDEEKYGRYMFKFWLHPRHPDYQTERAKWLPFLESIDPTGEKNYVKLYGGL